MFILNLKYAVLLIVRVFVVHKNIILSMFILNLKYAFEKHGVPLQRNLGQYHTLQHQNISNDHLTFNGQESMTSQGSIHCNWKCT